MSNAQKKRRISGFVKGMIIYAVLFLLIAAAGLVFFWDYMEEYEISRPKTAINAYMQNLTEEHICDMSEELIGQVDKNFQTTEQSRAYIMDAIEDITYAKKSKECTDSRQVFVLRTGTRVIGEFSIVMAGESKYGFTPWHLEQEHFDLSALDLFGTGYAITVPSDHTVTVNGYVLDSAYIAEEMIPYEPIADYYADYKLPYRVQYAVPPIMGEHDAVITDPDGNEILFDENTDWTPYFHNCTEEELAALNKFAAEFVDRYTSFTGSTRKSRHLYYSRLLKYVVAGTDFSKRLSDAVEGLEFGQTQGNKVVSVTAHHFVRLAEGKYLCDVTYEVDTIGHKGTVRTTTNARIVAVQTDSGLKAESMNVY